MRRRFVLAGAVLASISAAQPVWAGPAAYATDFENGVGPEWTNHVSDVTPGTAAHPATHFLGQLGADTVRFTVSSLPRHTSVTLAFDLYVIRSWDGSRATGPGGELVGPDLWGLDVAGGQRLLFTSFSNYDGYPETQSYPGFYPDATYGRQRGAAEVNTLGYTFGTDAATAVPMDAVYHMTFTFPHTAGTLSLYFYGAPNEAKTNESWGLDNVSVSRDYAPPPTPGDVDANGATDISDAETALRLLTGVDPLTLDAAARADVAPYAGINGHAHGDGVLDWNDIREILTLSAGLTP